MGYYNLLHAKRNKTILRQLMILKQNNSKEKIIGVTAGASIDEGIIRDMIKKIKIIK